MAEGNKPQTRAAAALAKGKSPVPLEPTSPMGRRSLRNTPVAEAVKREALSHAGVGASGSKPTRRFRPNVAGAKGLRSIPEETSRVDNQLDIAAMMKAVNEGDVGTPHPVESRSIEPLAQHVTPEKEVATVPTVPKKKRTPRASNTKERTPRESSRPNSANLGQTRPTIGRLRPKGAAFPLSDPSEEDAPLDIFGDEETVSDVVGLAVPSNPDEVDAGCFSGIHEVSSTGVPGGLHSLDNNLKLWSSR